jgi:hypothetical protein
MQVLVGTGAGLVDLGAGRTVAFDGQEVTAMADGWVVLDRNHVRRTDGAVGHTLEGPAVTCVASRDGGEALAGTAEAHLLRVGATALRVDAFERVKGREQWYTPWGGPPDVRSISIGPTGTALVNVHVGGILRSVDDGASWEPTIDIDDDVHQVLATDGRVAVAACAYGLAVSDDDGASWAIRDEGLHAPYSRAVALCGDMVLLSASTGPGGSRAAVYRRPLRGDGPFERCSAGLPEWFDGNVDTFCLAGAPDGRAALAAPGGDVFVSTDAGAMWDKAASALPHVRCISID